MKVLLKGKLWRCPHLYEGDGSRVRVVCGHHLPLAVGSRRASEVRTLTASHPVAYTLHMSTCAYAFMSYVWSTKSLCHRLKSGLHVCVYVCMPSQSHPI